MSLVELIWRTSVDFIRDYSSIAGLTHAANGKSIGRSIYWIALFTVGLAFTLDQLIDLVNVSPDQSLSLS